MVDVLLVNTSNSWKIEVRNGVEAALQQTAVRFFRAT